MLACRGASWTCATSNPTLRVTDYSSDSGSHSHSASRHSAAVLLTSHPLRRAHVGRGSLGSE